MFASTIRILVVDDSNTVRDLVRNELATLGFKNVILAEDGQDALKKLETEQKAADPIGLVICDWNMPKMSGIDLLQAMKKVPYWSKIPFVLLTSEAEMANVWTAIEAGVDSYIVKPLGVGTLSMKLSEVYKKIAGM